jgi:hypothetical protein
MWFVFRVVSLFSHIGFGTRRDGNIKEALDVSRIHRLYFGFTKLLLHPRVEIMIVVLMFPYEYCD